MTIKVAINGYGRIGRNILRAHYEGGKKHDIQIVAINDLGDAGINAHLTQYDTAHGKFPGTVTVEGEAVPLVVKGRHDVSAVPRIVPVLKAMTALVLADFMLLQRGARL